METVLEFSLMNQKSKAPLWVHSHIKTLFLNAEPKGCSGPLRGHPGWAGPAKEELHSQAAHEKAKDLIQKDWTRMPECDQTGPVQGQLAAHLCGCHREFGVKSSTLDTIL